MAEGVVI